MRDLSLHILDICQNSIKAQAKNVEIEIEVKDDLIDIKINDDGQGMSKEILKKVQDPFYTTRTTRKIGLGIPLFKEAARSAGGTFDIRSTQNMGTSIAATFEKDHIDRQPLGNLEETVATLILTDHEIDYSIHLKYKQHQYDFSTKQVKEQLNELKINDFEIINWIENDISEGIKTVFGGALNEIHS